jgi:glycosyltransferase involved in cell wall biosynthesis
VNILFISRWFPWPIDNGSKLRIYNLIRGLAQYHDVSLISFIDQPDFNTNTTKISELCKEIHTLPWITYNPSRARAKLGLLSLTPRSVVDTYSQDMELTVRRMVNSNAYDRIVASQIDTAGYRRFFDATPSLFEEIEVASIYDKTMSSTVWQGFRNRLTWEKHRFYLRDLLKEFQAGTVVSQQEHKLVSRFITQSTPIEVIPNCVDLVEYQGIQEHPRPNTLIFTGSFRYSANYDAMAWFISKVYPTIQSQVPEVHLTITGDSAGQTLPAASNVTITGVLEDIRPILAKSWVSVAPILSGGGTRLKILEAMALRTPVVATSKGAEGLDVQDGKHILIADTSQYFAKAVIRLLTETELRQIIVENGYQLVREQYDWAIVMPRYINLLQQMV